MQARRRSCQNLRDALSSPELPKLQTIAATIKSAIGRVREWTAGEIGERNKSQMADAMSSLEQEVTNVEGGLIFSGPAILTTYVSHLTAMASSDESVTFSEPAARTELRAIEDFLIDRSFEVSTKLTRILNNMQREIRG